MNFFLTIVLLVFTFNVNAFWNNNNAPWSNNYNNNAFGNGGYRENNGFIAYNPFSTFSPDWFTEEMNDFADEFSNNGWNNNHYNAYNPYNYNSWNRGNAPWGNNMPWNNAPWGNNRR